MKTSRKPEARKPELHIAAESAGVRVPVSLARVVDVARMVLRAERVTDGMISVTFVSAPRIAAINAKHLRRRGATDVISFGFANVPRDALIADIYIAPSVASRNARRHGAGVREEIIRLVVHGLLHAAGHDHPESEARVLSPMWHRQELLVKRFVARDAKRPASRTRASARRTA